MEKKFPVALTFGALAVITLMLTFGIDFLLFAVEGAPAEETILRDHHPGEHASAKQARGVFWVVVLGGLVAFGALTFLSTFLKGDDDAPIDYDRL